MWELLLLPVWWIATSPTVREFVSQGAVDTLGLEKAGRKLVTLCVFFIDISRRHFVIILFSPKFRS
jgi:hypothetical protein